MGAACAASEQGDSQQIVPQTVHQSLGKVLGVGYLGGHANKLNSPSAKPKARAASLHRLTLADCDR